MMYRNGLSVSADGNIGLLAGATLGGGTTINWHNCVKPSAEVRREWASEHGLTDVDTPEFDRHLEAVLARMSANDECSDLNGPHQRMTEGAQELGWSLHTAVRNVDPDTYDPVAAGYTQFGDPSGSKRGTLNTYLRDAFDTRRADPGEHPGRPGLHRGRPRLRASPRRTPTPTRARPGGSR